MKVIVPLYGQNLVKSQVNYTGTYLANHLDGFTHNNVRYFLKTQRFTSRKRWQQGCPQVGLGVRGHVLFGGTVLEQHHNRRIELVCCQYSSSVHSVMAGIGLVTCVYVNFETNPLWLIDYRLFAHDDGKLEHVADMLAQLAPRGITYRTVLINTQLVCHHAVVKVVAHRRKSLLVSAEKQPLGRRLWRSPSLAVRGLPGLVDCRGRTEHIHESKEYAQRLQVETFPRMGAPHRTAASLPTRSNSWI